MLSYAEKLAELSKIVDTFEVSVISDRFKVNQTFGFRSEEDAREFAHLMVDAGRETHEEGEADEYLQVYTYDEVFRDYGSPAFGKGWRVEVYECFPRAEDTEDILSRKRFLFGHRFGAYRMARPDSKVFMSFYGRDCDGYSWGQVCEYDCITSADEDTQGRYASADGPMDYSMITRDQFEMIYCCE